MNQKSRTSLFLMEMIISVLLFCVTSAVCMQLFVQAHLQQKETRELQFATTQTQSIAEIIQNCNACDLDTVLQEIQRIYPLAQKNSDYIVIGYDDEFSPCDVINSNSYQITITTNLEDQMRTSSIVVMEKINHNVIYELNVQKYIRNLMVSVRSTDEE